MVMHIFITNKLYTFNNVPVIKYSNHRFYILPLKCRFGGDAGLSMPSYNIQSDYYRNLELWFIRIYDTVFCFQI